MANRDLRAYVLWFAQAMEERLAANDHKGGWSEETLGYLVRRLDEELNEFWRVTEECPENVLREAADVANFLMMIAERCSKDK